MFTTSTTMACPAKNPDLVNKIGFFHKNLLGARDDGAGKSKPRTIIRYYRAPGSANKRFGRVFSALIPGKP
jgi:hypothetical protein